ncbi:DUF6602 domain-containing protein [Streptomyces sp. NPDC087219]|uniref:DUF6602 domain-containing protein n=1 Tax=Streptomyces sp. NPDC087219 TaxID=3365770 RepID=UPI003819841E
MGQHDLIQFFDQMSTQLSAEYTRIWSKTREDPGTAGDEGEENWADFLREILPARFQVVTKGRILSTRGVHTPQIDVLVLSPDYPQFMARRRTKTYLADGVVAAFECKNTLRAQHLRDAARTAAAVRAVTTERSGDPHKELFGAPVYGLLAHSHVWKERGSTPAAHIDRELYDGMKLASHPKDLLDVVCVADLATWWPCRGTAWTHHPESNGEPRIEAQLSRHEGRGTPVMALATTLLRLLAWDQPSLRPIANYFQAVASTIGGGPSRTWSMDLYSASVRTQLTSMPHRRGSFSYWDPWDSVLM